MKFIRKIVRFLILVPTSHFSQLTHKILFVFNINCLLSYVTMKLCAEALQSLFHKCFQTSYIFVFWMTVKTLSLCEISSSHGCEYEVQICLLGCTLITLMMEAARTSET
jgi:hypothetical protein